MSEYPALAEVDIDALQIVSYPAPVLRVKSEPVTVFDETVERLVRKMLSLMHLNQGVGLAAPQVGIPVRLFVWNPSGEPTDDYVCINPVLSSSGEGIDASEGCLSLPEIHVNVRRAATVRIEADQLDGSSVKLEGEGLVARIWQHENDHLDGRLIIDYQDSEDAIANRKALKDLEARYKPPRGKASARGKGRARPRKNRLRR